MTASVIVPNHRSEATLPRTLASLAAAARGLDVEIVVSEDPEGRGLPWARNRGLDRAKGEAVFFCDADDAVAPDFFRHPLAALAATGADLCLFQYAQAPLKRTYDLSGNAAVRAALLPAFAGYSFDDVRRWNAGGDLAAHREPGSVCRAAFRRDFLARRAIRFDERLLIFEDAPFMTECALAATRVTSLAESLYVYDENPQGLTAHHWHGTRYWNYKFDVLDVRKRLERRYGGLWPHCEASCVLAALELLRARKGFWRYVRDPVVRRAFRGFPWPLGRLASAAAAFARGRS